MPSVMEMFIKGGFMNAKVRRDITGKSCFHPPGPEENIH